MSADLVKLPFGEAVPHVMIRMIVDGLKRMEANGRQDIILDLMKKVQDDSHRLNLDSIPLLTRMMLIKDGKIHESIRIILSYSVAVFDGNEIYVIDLDQSVEKKEQIQRAVDILDPREVNALGMATLQGFKLTDCNGYWKILQFCRNGIPYPELRLALLYAAQKQVPS
ncbi:hypothetical protein BH10PAT2_BH10PAT2_3240 [soil metagenome]